MSDFTSHSRKQYLCVKDLISTDEGRPLQETRYEYDEEGMLKSQFTTIYTTTSNRAEPVAIRETERDAYGILVGETLLGEQGKRYHFARKVLYERGEDGLLERVTVFGETSGGIVYFIGYHGVFAHRRGLPERVRYVTADGGLRREFRYEYDEQAHRVGTYVRLSWNESFAVSHRREFQYDEHGRTIHLADFVTGQPPKQYHMDRYYDDEGRCTYAVFMLDPDFLEDKETLVPGFFHDYEYQEFPLAPLREG